MVKNCGIDFGTSNSALAVAIDRTVSLARIEGDDITLPSAIFFPHDNPPQFGRAAIQLFTEGEEGRFMRSLKRILGTSLIEQGTVVNGRHIRFDDIIGNFIGHIKTRAETEIDDTLDNVVMGRPVHFVDGDDAANTRAQNNLDDIARSVGFKNVEFQYEPIAAAFAHERMVTGEKLAIVIYIGGGTSDFTVIRLSHAHRDTQDRKNDILANSGVRIGGNDFDRELSLGAFMPVLGYKTSYSENGKILPMPSSPFFGMSEWSKINFLYTPRTKSALQRLLPQCHAKQKFERFIKILKAEAGHHLLSVVEDSKVSLTGQTQIDADLGFIEDGLTVNVTQAGFNQAVEKHVATIAQFISSCLQQAGVSAGQIELVILTGGTTEVPLVKETVRIHFPDAEFSEGNKLSSVGLGLGYESIRRFG